MPTIVKTMSREETDYQYNPTLWSRRLPSDQLLPEHIAFTTRESESYREAVEWESVPFGEGEYAGEMDSFRAGLSDDAPVVVYIHGGWWQWFDPKQFSFLAKPFNDQGFAVIMPAYRMAQDWNNDRPMESIITQMEHAVAKVLADAHKRGASSVHLVGHSAGGHLVSVLRRTDWSKYGVTADAAKLLKSAFSLAGLFDIRYLLDSFVNDAIKMTPQSAEAVSPQLMEAVTKALCPLHLIVPENDTAEFFRQTKQYHQKLTQDGENCHLHVAVSRDHLDLIERLVDYHDPLFEYMTTHMRSELGPETALQATKEASLRWQSSFNSQNAEGCAAQHEADALMEARPFGKFYGTEQIQAFWQKLMDDGFDKVEYLEPKFEVLDSRTVKVSSGWRMNKAHGVIHKELWVLGDDGKALLREDCFEVMG